MKTTQRFLNMKTLFGQKKIESNVGLFFHYSIHRYFKRLCNGSEIQKNYFYKDPLDLYEWTILFEIAKCFCIEGMWTGNLDAMLFLSYFGNVLFYYFVKMFCEDIYMWTFTIFLYSFVNGLFFFADETTGFCLVISLYTAIWIEISYVYRPRILHNKNKKKREKKFVKE